MLTVTDIDGAYAAWFDQHGCDSALVRPDWYLFGAAAGDAGIWQLIDEMIHALTPTAGAAGSSLAAPR